MNNFLATSRLRLCLVSGAAALLIAGCADNPTRHPPTSNVQRTVVPKPRVENATAPTTAQRTTGNRAEARRDHDGGLPEQTGILACDEYLASYKACHRAANIYAPADVEHRYELMRKTLLRDSLDPQSHDQMAARCDALATSLRDAMHGKACQPLPADAKSSLP